MAKRLTRNRKGSIVLPSGETITKREQQQFKSVMGSYRYHREQALKNPTRAEKYLVMNEHSDFTIMKRSAGFGQFTSKAQFKEKIRWIKAINKGYAEEDRADVYQQNYAKVLFDIYKDKSGPAIELLMTRDPDAFRRAVESDELTEIGEHYHEDPRELEERLQKTMYELKQIKEISPNYQRKPRKKL